METVRRVWGDKRYHSWNYHLREIFGEKVFKVALDAGFSCPNRDGTVGRGGCIFCSARGSGDFAGARNLDLKQQFRTVRDQVRSKWPKAKYIGYFQAYSNTYGPAGRLRALYEEILHETDVVGLSVATRPDCLPDDVVAVLAEMNNKTYLWVELGLQTIHERTLALINRGHSHATFVEGVDKLRRCGIRVCAHIILGLPGENREDMLATAREVARLPVQGVKIHLLHVLTGTPLLKMYEQGEFDLLDRESYVNLVVDILEILPPEMVIHRLTGDGPPEQLVGPFWSRRKWEVLNAIDAELVRRDSWQGKAYMPEL